MADTPVGKRIEQEEGRVRWVYFDSEGYATIGVGCLVDQKRGGGLRDIEIDFILNNRINECETELSKRFPWTKNLDDVRHGALVNMAFQLGLDGLSNFQHFLAYLQAGNYLLASKEMLDSKWAKQTPGRAKRISDEILTGEWQWKV